MQSYMCMCKGSGIQDRSHYQMPFLRYCPFWCLWHSLLTGHGTNTLAYVGQSVPSRDIAAWFNSNDIENTRKTFVVINIPLVNSKTNKSQNKICKESNKSQIWCITHSFYSIDFKDFYITLHFRCLNILE